MYIICRINAKRIEKTRIFLLLSLFFIVACSETKVEVTFFKNGQIKEKAEIVNNKRNGISWGYDSTGTLLRKTTWKDGRRNGLAEVYYPSGKISMRGDLIFGEPFEMISYYESGKIKRLTTMTRRVIL